MTLYSAQEEKNQAPFPEPATPDIFDAIDLACALQRLHVSRERYHASVARRHKLSVSELDCLCYCHIDGPLPSRRLAELLGVTPSAVTSMVDTLVRRELAQRSAHPRDRRVILVGASRVGSAIVDDLARRLADRTGFAATAAADAISLLGQIATTLDICAQNVAANEE